MKRAADLRSSGYSWDQIGAKLGRSGDTCRRWPWLYPEVWSQLLRRADHQATWLVRGMAKSVLQNLLLSKDPKIQAQAVGLAVKFGEPLEPIPPASATPSSDTPENSEVSHVRSLTTEQRQDLVDRSRKRREPDGDGGAGGAEQGAEPGPEEPE
jgi:hypothetical protein